MPIEAIWWVFSHPTGPGHMHLSRENRSEAIVELGILWLATEEQVTRIRRNEYCSSILKIDTHLIFSLTNWGLFQGHIRPSLLLHSGKVTLTCSISRSAEINLQCGIESSCFGVRNTWPIMCTKSRVISWWRVLENRIDFCLVKWMSGEPRWFLFNSQSLESIGNHI